MGKGPAKRVRIADPKDNQGSLQSNAPSIQPRKQKKKPVKDDEEADLNELEKDLLDDDTEHKLSDKKSVKKSGKGSSKKSSVKKDKDIPIDMSEVVGLDLQLGKSNKSKEVQNEQNKISKQKKKVQR